MFQTLFTWYALSVGGTLSDAIQHMLYIVFPLNVHRKIVVKEKNPCCTRGTPLLLSSLSNFEIFAIIILERRKQHKKEIVRNVSECILENSRERKKNSML